MKRKLLFVCAALLGMSAWAQTDVTSTYLVNPSFELKAEGTASTAVALSKTGGTYYGWSLPNLGSEYANVSIGSSSACDGNGYGIPSSASDGDFYFYNRKGWATQAGELSQTTTLPAGKYFITVDYKAYEKKTTNGTLGFSINGTSVLSTKPYYAAGANEGSWANTDPWKTVGAWFTIETEGEVKIAITESLVGGDARADLYLDNVRLYKWDTNDETNYANATAESPLDVTAKFVTNPYFDSNVDGWTTTTGAQNKGRATNKDGAHSGGFWENWNSKVGAGKMSQTLTGLPDGFYLVSASVHATSGTGANVSLFAGEAKQVITWNAAPAFYSVKTTKVTGGSLEIGVEVGEGNACQWIGLDNVRVQYLGNLELATAEDYEALNNAIATAEAKTLGFQKDEYAPYVNVVALSALKTAKAINQEADNEKSVVVAATEALSNATWTANSEEINAVYDGTFANAENDGAPAGWTMSDNTLGGATHSRAFVGDSRLEEFNETKSGLFIRFDGTNSSRGSWYHYGKTEGYTMPLAANTKYCVTVDAKNWGDKTGKPLKLSVTGPEGFTSVDTQINTTHDADKDNEAPQKMTLNFTTAEAGNYVINFSCPGDGNEHMCLISNIVLMTSKEVSADMTISSVGTATFCAPFDVEIPEGVTAYEAKIADNSWVKLEDAKLVEGKLPAGTPVVLKGEAMQKTFTDVPTVTVTKSSCLVGNLGTEKVEVVANAGNYLLQKNDGVLAWYQVKNTGLYIGVNRCYLEFSGDNAREFFPMDFDNPTGIDSIATEAKTKADGKYLVNGKIVVVKAGKVYEVK